MARILGFTYGELRGKIGGTVYSRNKAGAYARAKVTPVNPQTVRQQTQRYRFGLMSILYQSLTNITKDCWQSFAGTHFNPLKGNNTGIYTGGNAFVALRQSAGQGNDYANFQEGTNGATAVNVNIIPYNAVIDPPQYPTSNTIQSLTGVAHRFEIGGLQIDEAGRAQFNLIFPDLSPTSPEQFNSFVNAENQNFGIGIYISNNLKFEGSKPNTALKLNFADTGVIEGITLTPSGNLEMADTTNLVIASSVDQANTRDFPCANDWVLATPFVRSQDGAQKLMPPMYVQVQAV